ncbi:MAG: tetratricopeptide repeat protein [Thermodesulfobacteriota bacterium]
MRIQIIRSLIFGGILAFIFVFHTIPGNAYSSDKTLNDSTDNTAEKSSAYEYFTQGRNVYLLSTPEGYEASVNWYKKAIAADEKYASAYAGLGESYAFWGGSKGQNGDQDYEVLYNQSLNYSVKAVELAPNLGHSHRALATSYYALGRFEEAEREALRAINMDPNDAEAYFIAWKAEGENPESVYIRKALDINPNLLMAHNDLGAAYMASGDYDKAIYHLTRTAELNPDSALVHNNLGHALEKTGKTEDAIKEYKKAIDIDPNNDLTHSNLATVLVSKGEMGKATNEYKKAVEINPNSALFHYNLGTALLLGGKIEEGITELKRTIEINPHFGEAYTNLGRALMEVGKTDEAIDALRKAIEINPDDELAHRHLSRVSGEACNTENTSSYRAHY